MSVKLLRLRRFSLTQNLQGEVQSLPSFTARTFYRTPAPNRLQESSQFLIEGFLSGRAELPACDLRRHALPGSSQTEHCYVLPGVIQ